MSTIEVLTPGVQTTVQDYPGRLGYWAVGIPPSGPMDGLSFRIANYLVGNPDGAPGLEITLVGPKLRFAHDTTVALFGAPTAPSINGAAAPFGAPFTVPAGHILDTGTARGPGLRVYLAVRNGLDVPKYLGSSAAFTLGGFGGHAAGAALRPGDCLEVRAAPYPGADQPRHLPKGWQLPLERRWGIGVVYGPHGAPEFFTPRDIQVFFATEWEVHPSSARTGIRLVGPKPEWARTDGGDAGLHPSNIHDVAYAVGAVDFTGDMPIILGPDGPSLGGFVCPATIVQAELWKTGQLRPGDRVRFCPVTVADAQSRTKTISASFQAGKPPELQPLPKRKPTSPVIDEVRPPDHAVGRVLRISGDANLLVEYGPMALDLRLRFRVHALMQRLQAEKLPGVIDLTPGIRSLQIHFDANRLSVSKLVDCIRRLDADVDASGTNRVQNRIVRLPLSWDDPATRLAIERYTRSVRPDAPWAPSNIEFIRRINGLASTEQVRDIVFGASYLVLGLGDVYLGAPVATPIDPRQRLITTKYNPARTWTPENAVGIGGAYLCVYGMEGPGGYQFVGRTVQVFSRKGPTNSFRGGYPWLLRFFDELRFYPVSTEELADQRAGFLDGKFDVDIQEHQFDLAEHERFLAEQATSIARFREHQQAAFRAERERWAARGEAGSRAPGVASTGELRAP